MLNNLHLRVMIDDLYKILNVKPNVSLYKIALHYKMLSKKLILSNDKNSKIDFYQINGAFEVLRNENVRKYYNILYKISVKKQTNISNLTIDKYFSIVNNYIFKGKERADKIINNENFRLVNSIKRSLVLSFFIGTIKLYTRYPHLIATPLAGFCFLLIGSIVFLRDIFGVSSDFWFLGLINVYANFRYFTIDLMNEEC